jgi:hypothetical protein
VLYGGGGCIDCPAELRELVATGKARVPDFEALEGRHEGLRTALRATLAQLRREARRMQQEVNELEVGAVRESLADVFHAQLFGQKKWRSVERPAGVVF